MFDSTKPHEFTDRKGGLVTARRLTEPEKLETPNGTVIAKSGTWKVEDGHQVLVLENEQFHATYQPT